MTTAGFKTEWQKAMARYAADGFEHFWEHDIRAKAGSDAKSDEAASELLDHTTTSTTKRHYRHAPVKRMPAR